MPPPRKLVPLTVLSVTGLSVNVATPLGRVDLLLDVVEAAPLRRSGPITAKTASYRCSTLLSSTSTRPPPTPLGGRVAGQGVRHQPNTCQASAEHVSGLTR